MYASCVELERAIKRSVRAEKREVELKLENEELKEENRLLKEQLDSIKQCTCPNEDPEEEVVQTYIFVSRS